MFPPPLPKEKEGGGGGPRPKRDGESARQDKRKEKERKEGRKGASAYREGVLKGGRMSRGNVCVSFFSFLFRERDGGSRRGKAGQDTPLAKDGKRTDEK